MRKCLTSLLLFIIVTAVGLAAQSYQPATLLINGSQTPAQIPDLVGYRAVFVFIEDPADSQPDTTRVTELAFTNIADASAFTTSMQAFYPQYAAASTRAAKDAIVQSYITALNASLSTTGAAQLNAFVQASKSRINVYGNVVNGQNVVLYTTYYSSTALDTGTVDSIWDDYASDEGYDDVGMGAGLVCSDSPTNPLFQFGSTSIPGIVNGQSSSVGDNIPNGSTSGFESGGGYPGAGVVYTFTITYNFRQSCTIDGRDGWTQAFSLTLTWQAEIAYTKLLETGIAYGCSTNHAGVTTCSYPVSPWCQVANPDFVTSAVVDSQFWAAWYGEAACTRLGSSGPWTCLFGFAEGTTNQIRAGSFGGGPNCTYNP